MHVVADHIVVNGSATLTAGGGSSTFGTDARAGGGGVIVIVTQDPEPAGLTVDASGGTNTSSGTDGTFRWIGALRSVRRATTPAACGTHPNARRTPRRTSSR
jgi:hypothetical protein